MLRVLGDVHIWDGEPCRSDGEDCEMFASDCRPCDHAINGGKSVSPEFIAERVEWLRCKYANEDALPHDIVAALNEVTDVALQLFELRGVVVDRETGDAITI